MIKVLFSARDALWPDYEEALALAFQRAGVSVDLARDHPPDQVDYIVYAPNGPLQDFSPFSRAKAVLNLWAGVEDVADNPTLTIPLARMVDHGLTQGMIEWVTGHVLRHHLGMDRHVLGQDGVWREEIPPLAEDRRVGILGAGTLGIACGSALQGLGFQVSGWSRRPKTDPAFECLSGDAGLMEVLSRADILVLLLPLTPETTCLLDAERLAAAKTGAVIVNPGRGPLIDDDALLEALDSGQISHATLDVFREEPLPANHPFWSHGSVTVTPHIASSTRKRTASEVIAENIRRGEAGEPFLHLVDRGAGY